MAIGSGLATSIGFAAETTYGTYVAPTRFYEFNSEDVKKTQNFVQGGGLAAGRLAQLATRRAFTTEAAGGTVELEVANKGMGLLLNHLMGGTATVTQQAATAAYLQSHALADNIGKSLTLQEGVADLTGTVRAQTFKGCKVLSAEFSCAQDELLTANFELDAQRYSEVESLAAPSYLAGVAPFHSQHMNVKLGTYGSETSVANSVRSVTCKIERGQATDRFYAGAAVPGTKAEPIMNDWVKVTGSLEVDFTNKADFVDRFHGNTSTALVLEWVGPLIASTYYQTFRIKVPTVFFTGDTPTVDGADLVNVTVPFEAQFDGTNPLATIEYISTDTAI